MDVSFRPLPDRPSSIGPLKAYHVLVGAEVIGTVEQHVHMIEKAIKGSRILASRRPAKRWQCALASHAGRWSKSHLSRKDALIKRNVYS